MNRFHWVSIMSLKCSCRQQRLTELVIAVFVFVSHLYTVISTWRWAVHLVVLLHACVGLFQGILSILYVPSRMFCVFLYIFCLFWVSEKTCLQNFLLYDVIMCFVCIGVHVFICLYLHCSIWKHALGIAVAKNILVECEFCQTLFIFLPLFAAVHIRMYLVVLMLFWSLCVVLVHCTAVWNGVPTHTRVWQFNRF